MFVMRNMFIDMYHPERQHAARRSASWPRASCDVEIERFDLLDLEESGLSAGSEMESGSCTSAPTSEVYVRRAHPTVNLGTEPHYQPMPPRPYRCPFCAETFTKWGLCQVHLNRDPCLSRVEGVMLDQEMLHGLCRGERHLSLHDALKAGIEDMAWAQLQASPQEVQQEDSSTLLPLHIALMKMASPDLVLALLAAHPEGARAETRELEFPIHLALGWGELSDDVVLGLLHAYPDGAKRRNSWGILPLHIALRKAAHRVVPELLEAFPEAANDEDSAGYWPLHHALWRNSPPSVTLLLVQVCPKAAQRIGADGNLPLHYALDRSQSAEVILELIKAFPEGPSAVGNSCSSQLLRACLPLHIAVHHCLSPQVVEALLEAHPGGAVAAIGEGRWEGSTALHVALHQSSEDGHGSCHPDVLAILLNHKANPLAEDRQGRTPLEMLQACTLAKGEKPGQAVVAMLRASAAELDLCSSFASKATWFSACLRLLQKPELERRRQRPVVATVLRGQVLEGLCAALQGKHHTALLGGLAVSIGGESAEGDGVVREVLSLLAHELCDGDMGLFQEDSAGGGLHPASRSGVQPDHLEYFDLVGKLIGVALSSGTVLPARFSTPLLKGLLGQRLEVDDLRHVDGMLHRNSVEHLRTLPESELRDLAIPFSYDEDFFGCVKSVQLLPCGGAVQCVDSYQTLDIYLRLVSQHLMVGRVSQQIEALHRGVHGLVPEPLLCVAGEKLSAEDLCQLIAGVAEIDDAVVEDWRANTCYEGGYHASHPTVKAFWAVVQNRFSPRQRGALLRFIHGSSRAPAHGFASLRGYQGQPHPFTVQWEAAPARGAEECREAYPRPRTCFNTLRLPDYRSAEEVERRLKAVISETAAGFDEGAVAAL